MKKIILVTGATAGFGEAIAIKFAQAGYSCIITGRRKDRLEKLADNLIKQYNTKVHILHFDVRDKHQVAEAINSLPQEWKKIDVLVNNAGLALDRTSIENGSTDDWDTMIDTNIKGLLYVTKAIVPFMINNKKGHVINIGSVAAKDRYQYGNVYCATKAAVDSVSHGMRIDLLPYKIKVTAIHPGAAETEFSLVRFKGDAAKAKQVYDGFTPLTATDIADTVFYCATLPEHVCINDLTITPTAQADGIYFYKQ
jgi:NADP-dependent 3-hydroxy acid dehydrogenase YdfG